MKRNELYAEITTLKTYLASTDYHILKSAESDYIVPVDILQERSSARTRINEIEIELQNEQDSKNS